MDFGSGKNVQGSIAPTGAFVDVNMEASITPDEVMRAGGFGATDSISSFLPGASDSTDFEAHLREGQDYEVLEGKNVGDDPKLSKKNQDDEDQVHKHNFNDIKTVEVNSEADIVSDEVNRAGGFGARDDISSFLPVASDFTDFEAHIRDVRGYEDMNEEINHPGLGWNSKTN